MGGDGAFHITSAEELTIPADETTGGGLLDSGVLPEIRGLLVGLRSAGGLPTRDSCALCCCWKVVLQVARSSLMAPSNVPLAGAKNLLPPLLGLRTTSPKSCNRTCLWTASGKLFAVLRTLSRMSCKVSATLASNVEAGGRSISATRLTGEEWLDDTSCSRTLFPRGEVCSRTFVFTGERFLEKPLR